MSENQGERRNAKEGNKTMTIKITRLTPAFAARIDGADITKPVDESTWAEIRAAFEEHSVLLFRGQP